MAMATANQLNDVQRRVVKVLERGGGRLSQSELVLASYLPYNIIAATVGSLKESGVVEVQSLPDSDLDLVVLKR
jgi:uncharacterized membrane protein